MKAVSVLLKTLKHSPLELLSFTFNGCYRPEPRDLQELDSAIMSKGVKNVLFCFENLRVDKTAEEVSEFALFRCEALANMVGCNSAGILQFSCIDRA